MEILENLFTWIFLIAFILFITFGVMWFRVRKDKDNPKYVKNKKYTLISLAVFVVAFVGFQVIPSSDDDDETAEAKTEQTSSSSKKESSEDDDSESAQKTLDKLTDALNHDLTSEDTGDTKWHWDKDEGAWLATLDPNSTMYQAMDDGQVSIWNSYVRDIQDASKTAKDEKLEDFSTFKLENPNNTDRIYLEVTDGKVKYNVGEDLD